MLVQKRLASNGPVSELPIQDGTCAPVMQRAGCEENGENLIHNLWIGMLITLLIN